MNEFILIEKLMKIEALFAGATTPTDQYEPKSHFRKPNHS